MSSSQANFYSTPTFEIFRRALITQTVQVFHGINAYTTLPRLGPDWAQDLLNVVVSGSGGLSKLRLPVKLSVAVGGQNLGPNSFWDFQQGNGTRQVVANFGSSLYYYSNDLALVTLIEQNAADTPPWFFTPANNILFGANGQRMMKWTGANWQLWGLVGPVNAPPAPGVVGGTLSPATGYLWGYAWKNSVTGHVSNISPSSPNTAAQANKGFTVLAAASTDAQVDTIVWFRILDGGGDLFRLCEVNINTGAVLTFAANANVVVTGGTGNLGITDNTPDSALDQTTTGPLINFPPPVGRYTATGQGRVVIFNLIGAPQQIAYSGLEQIYLGRPEESFPPNNRLLLSIGAESIAGGTVIHAGIVAFSQTGRMYMLRGALEDISISVPVNFSAFLEELPWTLGCFSPTTIQSTPYGVVWLAGDKTVQLFSGTQEPIDISTGVYPLLRAITPGTEGQCVSAYFNWLERDVYALACAVNGSLTTNRIFFFIVNKAPGSNTVQDVEVFLSDIPANLPGSIGYMGVISTSKLQRKLCLSAQGFIYELPVSQDTTGGLTLDETIIPATNGNLNAYWRSGYFGSADSPQRSKTFRWNRFLSDQDPKAFGQLQRYVNDETSTLLNPEIIGPVKISSSRVEMNHKAKRAAIEIQFPARDAPANVVELQVAAIATADR